jgi:SAM-dependent methyltransferase
VVGVDLAATAIREARERYASLPNLQFETGDFFAARGESDLDAIIEHTCFCAIPPKLRAVYRDTAARRLRTGGRLVAVFYLHPLETEDDPDDGPPWGCSVPELNGLFVDELFETLVSEVPARAFVDRENRELFRVHRRR